MLNRTGLCVVLAIAGAAACGGASENDFSGPLGGRATSAGSAGGAGKSTGGSTQGGTGGAGTGGSATGGTAQGGAGGSSNGGAGGTATGGTGVGGSGGDATSGTGGDIATGGIGAVGGTDPGLGGSSGSGMTSGGMAGGAGKPNGGSAGTGMTPTCDELSAQYADTLKAAQACNAKSGKDQCTQQEPGSVTCGCDVFVNPDNADAIAELEQIRAQYAMQCPKVLCPAIACIRPSGMCTADQGATASGHCTVGLATTQ